MKKVRIVAGYTIPAAGLVMGAVPAQAAVVHADATVKPDLTCTATAEYSAKSKYGTWQGFVSGAGGCATHQSGFWWAHRTGITERVRYRNAKDALLYSHLQGGTIGSCSAGAGWHACTYFSSGHTIKAAVGWLAATPNGSPNVVLNSGNALVGVTVP